tara:strand:- start:1237 stop:1353 length:117 start_codon:yes stop_codon:yes gene_type:complete
MSITWVLLGLAANAIIFVWGVFYLARAIKDNDNWKKEL